MDNSQNNIGYFPQMPVCDKHLSVELNSDFSLPDYQPEIRRLLSTRATVLSPNEYIGNSEAELSGEIIYKILYLGADNKVYSALLSDKYSFTAPLEFNSKCVNNDEVTLITTCKSESVNTRVLGPRKLNIRSKLVCHVLGASPHLYSPTLVGAHNSASIENMILNTSCISLKKCTGEPQLLTDFIALDKQIDNVRIIDSTSSLMISECVASGEKVNVKGEVFIKLLYCNDSESEYPLSMLRKLPFSISIPCDGADASFECCAFGEVIDEHFNVAENGIDVEITVVISTKCQKNESIPYINDSYSTEREVRCTSATVPVRTALKAYNGNLTQNEIFSLESIKLSPNMKIIDICSKADVNEMSEDNGRHYLKGNATYQIIYCLDGEYSSVEVNAPIKYELDPRAFASLNGKPLYDATVQIISSRARADAERLFVDSELDFLLLLQSEDSIEVLSEMTFGERLSKNEDEMVLCFPDKNESLWSVAKRYGEPQRKIRVQNSINDGDEPIKKKFLII